MFIDDFGELFLWFDSEIHLLGVSGRGFQSGEGAWIFLIKNATTSYFLASYNEYAFNIDSMTWNDKTIMWYNTSNGNNAGAIYQMNQANSIYWYIAFLQ